MSRLMGVLRLENLTKRFQQKVLAVDNVNLEVASGESIVFLGPSGCGKTTILRMIAGLARPTRGTIRLGEQAMSDDGGRFVPPERRRVGMVFQSYALWPHMSVGSNVAFGLTTSTARRNAKRSKT